MVNRDHQGHETVGIGQGKDFLVKVKGFPGIPKNLRQKYLQFTEELAIRKDFEYFTLKRG